MLELLLFIALCALLFSVSIFVFAWGLLASYGLVVDPKNSSRLDRVLSIAILSLGVFTSVSSVIIFWERFL